MTHITHVNSSRFRAPQRNEGSHERADRTSSGQDETCLAGVHSHAAHQELFDSETPFVRRHPMVALIEAR